MKIRRELKQNSHQAFGYMMRFYNEIKNVILIKFNLINLKNVN